MHGEAGGVRVFVRAVADRREEGVEAEAQPLASGTGASRRDDLGGVRPAAADDLAGIDDANVVEQQVRVAPLHAQHEGPRDVGQIQAAAAAFCIGNGKEVCELHRDRLPSAARDAVVRQLHAAPARVAIRQAHRNRGRLRQRLGVHVEDHLADWIRARPLGAVAGEVEAAFSECALGPVRQREQRPSISVRIGEDGEAPDQVVWIAGLRLPRIAHDGRPRVARALGQQRRLDVRAVHGNGKRRRAVRVEKELLDEGLARLRILERAAVVVREHRRRLAPLAAAPSRDIVGAFVDAHRVDFEALGQRALAAAKRRQVNRQVEGLVERR